MLAYRNGKYINTEAEKIVQAIKDSLSGQGSGGNDGFTTKVVIGLTEYTLQNGIITLPEYPIVPDVSYLVEDIETLKSEKVDKEDMLETVTETVTETAVVPTDANGYEYVDLGLPSGTLWAKYNVGASSETNFGNYYEYGAGNTLYNAPGSNAYNGTENPLPLSVDTARLVMGGDWHTPSTSHFEELYNYCDHSYTDNYNETGVSGYIFTGNGQTLFIPESRYYWDNGYVSNTTKTYLWTSEFSDGKGLMMTFDLNSNLIPNSSLSYIVYGNCVRGILDANKEITVEREIQRNINKYITRQELSDEYFIKDEDGDLWITKDGKLNPLMHPDLSTQPSLLPQRFGRYPMYEILCPFYKYRSDATNYTNGDFDTSLIPSDAIIIEGSVFGKGYCEALNSYRNPTTKRLCITNIINEFTPEFALVRYYIIPKNGGGGHGYGYYN